MVLGNTSGIVACELFLWNTGPEMVLAILALIRAVTAVILMVTLPDGVDTPAIVTPELALFTLCGLGGAVGAQDTVIFIGAVNTVWVAVTHPFLGDAHGSTILLVGFAFKLCLWVTGSLITVLKI